MLMVGPLHWMAVKYIMRYLKGILDLLLPQRHDITLRGFCDADWTGDANDMRSTMGYNFFVGIGTILWKCKKQSIIVSSRTEAKCMATSHCTKKAIWLR